MDISMRLAESEIVSAESALSGYHYKEGEFCSSPVDSRLVDNARLLSCISSSLETNDAHDIVKMIDGVISRWVPERGGCGCLDAFSSMQQRDAYVRIYTARWLILVSQRAHEKKDGKFVQPWE